MYSRPPLLGSGYTCHLWVSENLYFSLSPSTSLSDFFYAITRVFPHDHHGDTPPNPACNVYQFASFHAQADNGPEAQLNFGVHRKGLLVAFDFRNKTITERTKLSELQLQMFLLQVFRTPTSTLECLGEIRLRTFEDGVAMRLFFMFPQSLS